MALTACAGSAPAAETRAPVVAEPSDTDLLAALEQAPCPDVSDLRGMGIAPQKAQALAEARAEISQQIQVSLDARSESVKHQEVFQGNESLRSSWNQQVRQTATLANAQDARSVYSARQGERVGVVACMSRADAAKPFLERQTLLLDSLNAAIAVELAQNHPLRKRDAWRAAQEAYVRLLPVARVPESLGAQDPATTEAREATYRRLVEDYEAFRANYAFYWEPGRSEADPVVFGRLSARFKIETGTCAQGLRLSLESREPECAEGAFGIQCSYVPVLVGTSCSGETYFNLTAGALRGMGKYDEAEARQRLWAKVQSDAFWNQWFGELDKWRLE